VVRKNKWGILAERYAVPVLIALLDNKETKFSDLSPKMGSYNTIENLLGEMEKAGYIIQNNTNTPYKTTFITLTLKGQEIAKALKIAEEIATGERKSAEVLKPIDYETSAELQNKLS